MTTFLKSLQLAAPLLILTALGYFLKRINMLDDNSCKTISKLVLDVILPINIFISIYDSDFKTSFNLKLILFIVISNILVSILMLCISHLMSKDPKKLGALSQAGVRGNYSIFGLPLAISIYGSKIAGPMAIAIAFLTPLYNVYAISLFEHYQDSNISIGKQIINVLKTPIMIATLLAIIINLTKIHLPEFVYQTLSYISKSVTAISLINLGSSFNFKIEKSLIKFVTVAILFKLIVVPTISIASAISLGFKYDDLIVILVCATSPIATSAFSTAVCYNTDIKLTSSAVVYSYVFCAISIPLFLSILFSMGVI